jgi:hypothetical protein
MVGECLVEGITEVPAMSQIQLAILMSLRAE